MLSRVCEAFGCTPIEAEEELNQDADLVFDILEHRAYVQAYQTFERLDTYPLAQRAEIMNDPLIQIVQQIEAELVANGPTPEVER